MVELTASKATFTECTCAFSSKDPNGCKDIRVCLPSPRRQKGGSCSSKNRLGAITEKKKKKRKKKQQEKKKKKKQKQEQEQLQTQHKNA